MSEAAGRNGGGNTRGAILESLATIIAIGTLAACQGSDGSSAATADVPPPSAYTTDDDASAALDAGATLYDDNDAAPQPLCVLTGAPKAGPGDVLVYSEDFASTEVNPRKWNLGTGYLGHSTIQNTADPRNAVVSNGALSVITAKNPSDTVHPYVSGWLDSLGKFARTYGKIEFRARFSYASGVWYAIWGRPWTTPYPEIDLEIVNQPGKTNTDVYFVDHWAAPAAGVKADDRRSFTMLSTVDVAAFHTYTLHWNETDVSWERDGETVFQAKPQGVPHDPVFWIINAWAGGWPGAPPADTQFPNTFDVDYMRVYRVDGLVADPVVKVMNVQKSYATTDLLRVGIANFDEVCAHVEMWADGTLLQTASALPIRFPLSSLGSGSHDIKLVATDGERSTTATTTIVIQ